MSVPVEADALVVGGGPAGLAAALWLARYRRCVVLADSGRYRAARVDRSHGYLGRDPQDPMELLATGRAELLRYPTATVVPVEIDHVRPDGAGRFTAFAGRRQVTAHRVVLACGVEDDLPALNNFFEHYGRSAFHCSACDGYEARDRPVVAFGWDARLAGFATTLLNWAASVTIVTGGRRFDGDEVHRRRLADEGIEVVEDPAAGLEGTRGELAGLRLSSGRLVAADLMFFSLGHRPRTRLAQLLGCRLTEEGCVEVDHTGRTSVPGVYAAGDLVPGLQLIQVAAAEGATSGVACAESLFGEAGSPLSPAPAPVPPA